MSFPSILVAVQTSHSTSFAVHIFQMSDSNNNTSSTPSEILTQHQRQQGQPEQPGQQADWDQSQSQSAGSFFKSVPAGAKMTDDANKESN